MEQTPYTNEELRRDMKIIKAENHIQTVAVLVFFFFGIATLHDLSKHTTK